MNRVDEARWQKIFSNFLDNVNNDIYSSPSVTKDMMQAASLTLHEKCSDILKSQAITVLYEIGFMNNISLEESWQIYWIINYVTFSNSNVYLLKGTLRKLYTYLFEQVKSSLGIEFTYQPTETRNQDCIIITTSQFLSIKHAPTIRVLDYSYTIQKNFNKKVIIINSSEMNFHKNPNLAMNVEFCFLEEYSDTSKIIYKDEEFEFYQVGALMPNLEIYRKLLDIIYDIRPLIIYNIGASSLLSDLCTEFTATASLPCSYDIPITRSKYILLARNTEDRDLGILQALSKDQVVIETNYNYVEDSDTTVYTRKDFGLDEDSFIGCIVGNRLDLEIDDEFIALVEKIINTSDIHLVFIGGIKDENRITSKISDESKSKLHFLGHQSHAKAIIRLMDMYINPRRKGGGRSCFEALSYGVPTITPDFGDVYYTCGGKIGAKSYADMYSEIMRCYTDKDFYKNMSHEAALRATELSDIVTTQKGIIDSILMYELQEGDRQ